MTSTETSDWSNGSAPEAKRSKVVLWIIGCGAGALVVVLGLGLLATVIVPNVMRNLAEAQNAKAAADVAELAAQIHAHAVAHEGRYPATLDELLSPNGSLTSLPRDPWDHPYQYLPPSGPGATPRIFTLGRDGVRGGTGLDADVESP